VQERETTSPFESAESSELFADAELKDARRHEFSAGSSGSIGSSTERLPLFLRGALGQLIVQSVTAMQLLRCSPDSSWHACCSLAQLGALGGKTDGGSRSSGGGLAGLLGLSFLHEDGVRGRDDLDDLDEHSLSQAASKRLIARRAAHLHARVREARGARYERAHARHAALAAQRRAQQAAERSRDKVARDAMTQAADARRATERETVRRDLLLAAQRRAASSSALVAEPENGLRSALESEAAALLRTR
jgi:hypothetical protein